LKQFLPTALEPMQLLLSDFSTPHRKSQIKRNFHIFSRVWFGCWRAHTLLRLETS
jgi:hypothetical protein